MGNCRERIEVESMGVYPAKIVSHELDWRCANKLPNLITEKGRYETCCAQMRCDDCANELRNALKAIYGDLEKEQSKKLYKKIRRIKHNVEREAKQFLRLREFLERLEKHHFSYYKINGKQSHCIPK